MSHKGIEPAQARITRGKSLAFILHGLPSGWTLKAVVLTGSDVTDTPIDLPFERVTDGFRPFVTDRMTRVSVSVVDRSGDASPPCTALIFADDPARWTFPSRFIRVGHPEQHGAFEVADLPPEQYLAIALEHRYTPRDP